VGRKGGVPAASEGDGLAALRHDGGAGRLSRIG